MATMASSTLPHPFRSPLARGKAIAKTVAGPEHLKSTEAAGKFTNCRVEYNRWKKFAIRRLSVVRGAVDEEGTSTSNTEKTSSGALETKLGDSPTSAARESSLEDRKAAARAEIQSGRNTAIVTGAISVLLGVGYLVLLQLLDTRGIVLVPPPPEAFNP